MPLTCTSSPTPILFPSHDLEEWIVVKGNLTIILDDDKVFRYPGESIHIPLGAKHRAWNETSEDVIFIEVQTGTYFGEDDIVRLEDDFDRV